ncbi:MAG: succinate dehydrogenase, cytochrome b556 subunit [Burkholderiales bacterium]|nr:succinate dehydrogenase, cytochrome b556 subunit [Burkholderiales bacterium]
MSDAVKKNRRQFGPMTFAQTVHYRLPLAGFVSIFHRASGALLFVLLPFILYLLDYSLYSENSFDHLKGFVSNGFVKLIILALSWAYLHHFCAGIRYLVMDFHCALDKDSGRRTSVVVFAISLSLTALIAWKLFGASNG